MRFKRVFETFDEVAKARFCESSGSEHSPMESETDLYGLVNSFIERGNEEEIIIDNYGGKLEEENGLSVNFFGDLEIKDKLMKLLGYEESYNDVKRNIKTFVENAWLEIGDRSSTADFKRRLMTRLRDRGFDAVEELKQVVRIMSRAMKISMKKMDIYVPPWRQIGYMQAKWFGSYKRTINELLDDDKKKIDFSYKCVAKNRAVGFVAIPTISFYCRENFASNYNGIKMGNLAAALNG
ncbi:hypothetical protein RND71_025943 [Anisodus tanguticus]|uniref:Uncharacterized protein n=1 Tax=Anisodus tanguticus TaxID=243964 RepID=A0AAE1RMC1_9SOLA|nr:hypothetical protein RND71_025943 [Anisodus tanguticus]